MIVSIALHSARRKGDRNGPNSWVRDSKSPFGIIPAGRPGGIRPTEGDPTSLAVHRAPPPRSARTPEALR
jgi:hypothetical protein